MLLHLSSCFGLSVEEKKNVPHWINSTMMFVAFFPSLSFSRACFYVYCKLATMHRIHTTANCGGKKKMNCGRTDDMVWNKRRKERAEIVQQVMQKQRDLLSVSSSSRRFSFLLHFSIKCFLFTACMKNIENIWSIFQKVAHLSAIYV